MSDLSFVLNNSGTLRGGSSRPLPFEGIPAWKSVLDAFCKGAVPHCWAVKAPLEWHESLLKEMSRFFLCSSGCGCGACAGCTGFCHSSHPDMVVVGDFDKAGNIDACRSMVKELSLKPVVAERRLGVLPAADKLLAGAANSLLKIAEEPPSHVCLLFLMEGDDFLPTLKSRSRFTVLAAPMSRIASPAPTGDAQWADWAGNFKDGEDPVILLSSWVSHFLQTGDVKAAARTDRLRLLFSQKKLSQTMVCDLLILTLKEDLPFEPILGGFR